MRVSIGGMLDVRIPPEFSGVTSWEDYEPETLEKFSQWISENNNALILDVGSAFGIFSVAALFASKECSVIAFDGDLASIKATQRVCSFASGNRVQLVYGLVSDAPTTKGALTKAVDHTRQLIQNEDITGDIATTKYVCIHGNTDQDIPSYSIDTLLADLASDQTLLLKCDVEGAELLVLRGARKVIETTQPTLLMSVHPEALPDYGFTKKDVELFLQDVGYRWEVLAIDHEEHWWCEPVVA